MSQLTLAEPMSLALENHASDAEFLQHIQWAAETEEPLRQAAETGDLDEVWLHLTQNFFGLGQRANRKKVQERRYATAMSLWSRVPSDETESELQLAEIWVDLAARLEDLHQIAVSHQAKKKSLSTGKNNQLKTGTIKVPRKRMAHLTSYLETTADQPPTAFELLMIADLLRHAGSSLNAKVGIPLWRRALMAASEWGQKMDSSSSGEELASHMTNGELPWVLGLLFSQVSGSKALRKQGRQTLQSALEDHTDTDGTLAGEELEQLAAWLPPLVRAAEWGYASEDALWNTTSQERFDHLMSRISACYAGDGHLAFHHPDTPYILPLLLTGARLAGGSKKEWPLKFLLDMAEAEPELLGGSTSLKHSAKLKTSRRRPAEVETDSLVQQSDWARVACLRNHAGRDADVMTVTHHRSLPKIDFSMLGQVIFQGDWELEIAIGEENVPMPDEWSCVCWHTDSDGDYLELQYSIDENRRVERQVFLSRNDHFLVMADCISGAGEEKIEYTSRLPLVEYADVTRHEATREQIVRLADVQMRAFPLALPEDIVQSTAGSWGLSETSDKPCLELKQTAIGGLYAPLLFEWTPARQTNDADWRTLTITENGPKVKSDRASGHRLRIGNQQILIYRSLAPTDELRTILGHHTGHETIIARFNKAGDVKPLLIVE
ncbi:MAG: hypothetical protein KDA84_12440 [Planctomycetaceae bacterium]|nr:hypothetical protein [Planctomycetaceae bacterium]